MWYARFLSLALDLPGDGPFLTLMLVVLAIARVPFRGSSAPHSILRGSTDVLFDISGPSAFGYPVHRQALGFFLVHWTHPF